MRRRLEAEKRAKESRPKDSTHGIWDVLYRVKLPMLGSRSIQDMRMRGVVLSGNKDVDNDIRNRTIISFISINDMVEHFRNDVTVGVCDPLDTKKIYGAISDHIAAWKHQLEHGLNVGNAPVEDLLLLDQFAKAVYDQAKYLFAGEIMDDANIRYLQQVTNINPNNFFNAKGLQKLLKRRDGNVEVNVNGDVVINGGDEPEPERESYEDFFKERMMDLMQRGK